MPTSPVQKRLSNLRAVLAEPDLAHAATLEGDLASIGGADSFKKETGLS